MIDNNITNSTIDMINNGWVQEIVGGIVILIISTAISAVYYNYIKPWRNKKKKIGKTGLDSRFKKKTISSLVFNDNTEAALFFNDDYDYYEFTKHFINKSEGHYLVINTASLKEWKEILGSKKDHHDTNRLHLIYNYDETKDFFIINGKSEQESYDEIFDGRGRTTQIPVLKSLPDITEIGGDIRGVKLYEIAIDIPEYKDNNNYGRICLVYSHKRDENRRVFFIHVKVIRYIKLKSIIDKIKNSCIMHELKVA